MKIFAISDLHLSFSTDKPMDVFGGEWENHDIKIRESWINRIRPEDVVILPGDISWGLKSHDTVEDFKWIHELPGMKLFFKGNHDLWWTTPKKLNAMYEDMLFLQNNYYAAGDIAICGTRGWNLPQTSSQWTDHDEKIYQREMGRLRMSLDSAKKDGFERIIVAMHYPPLEKKNRDNGFTRIIKEYGVEKVLYGHLHGYNAHQNAFCGLYEGTEYQLVACDYLKFRPMLVETVDVMDGEKAENSSPEEKYIPESTEDCNLWKETTE